MQDGIAMFPKPPREEFDVPGIKAVLAKHDGVFPDPVRDDWLLVVHGEEAQQEVWSRRAESEQSSFHAGVVIVRADRVMFSFGELRRPELDTMRDLAQWVLEQYSPRIESNEAGDDWTDRCQSHIDPMFEPELPRRS